MITADLEQFTDKSLLIIYIEAFVELYNEKNHGQVYDIHEMIEFKNMCTSTAKHPYNLGAHCIIKRSSILHNAYVVLKNQEKIIFYGYNYIDWN